mmetsp:Transcript_8564/g.20359  ORF Transcript_8564/g.20359 Transcript_8564/m.20359 type:complete len:228 (-) Transcript_8564:362-1045(-)
MSSIISTSSTPSSKSSIACLATSAEASNAPSRSTGLAASMSTVSSCTYWFSTRAASAEITVERIKSSSEKNISASFASCSVEEIMYLLAAEIVAWLLVAIPGSAKSTTLKESKTSMAVSSETFIPSSSCLSSKCSAFVHKSCNWELLSKSERKMMGSTRASVEPLSAVCVSTPSSTTSHTRSSPAVPAAAGLRLSQCLATTVSASASKSCLQMLVGGTTSRTRLRRH